MLFANLVRLFVLTKLFSYKGFAKSGNFTKFAKFANQNAMARYINRLKVVLAEQHKTNLWLAKTLGKDPATVSKWCTNTAQPSLETLHEIAQSLKVDIRTLLNATDEVLMACEPSTPYGDHEGK